METDNTPPMAMETLFRHQVGARLARVQLRDIPSAELTDEDLINATKCRIILIRLSCMTDTVILMPVEERSVPLVDLRVHREMHSTRNHTKASFP